MAGTSLRVPGEEGLLLHTMVHCRVFLETTACFNAFDLLQLHQIFVSCIVEKRLGVEAMNNLLSLKVTRRTEFEGAQTAQSLTQQQVSKTLRDMGLSEADEVRCPKSGYWMMMFLFVLAETKISPKLHTPRVLPTIRVCLEGLELMI